MKNFLLLTKVMSKDTEMEMPDTGTKAKAYRMLGSAALLLIMIPCCVIVGFIVYIMTEALAETGGNTEGLELILQLLSVFGVVFSVMVVFNALYFSSDLNHLLPLPVKPGELVAAKFVNVYMAESMMEFMILFSALIGYFAAAGIRFVPILTGILGIFLLPVLPLVYCGLFALIAMACFSRLRLFRNVDLMTGLVSLLFVGLFIFSFAQMDSININNYLDSLTSGNNVFLNTMGRIFFTVPVFLKTLRTGSLAELLLFLLIHAGMIAILFFVGNRFYLRGVYLVSSMGKKEKKTAAAVKNAFQKNGIQKAYFRKEWRILYRTPAYRKYCVLVNIAWPVIAAALFVLPATKNFMQSFERLLSKGYVASDILTLLLVILLAFLATAMNSIASTSFTREGKHFSFIKHVPVSFRIQIRVKAAVSIVISGVTVLISVLIISGCMKVSVFRTLYFIVIGMLAVVCCTYIGLLLDAVHPKLAWEDEYGALRGNLNAFFNMAISILIAALFCVFGYVLFQYTRLDTDMIFTIYLVGLLLITVRIRSRAAIYAERSIQNDMYV